MPSPCPSYRPFTLAAFLVSLGKASAAAPTPGGASGRTPAGCGGSCSAVPAGSARQDRPRRWTIWASGVKYTVPPLARTAAQKSTSSQYMKYRSSSSPAASASAASHEQAGRRHPVDPPRSGRQPRQPHRRRAPHEQLLPQLGERRHHAAERQLRMAVAVHDLRPDHRRAGKLPQRANQAIDGAVGHDRVAVEQQHQLALGASDALVVRGRESDVRVERDDSNVRPLRSHHIDAAVSRRVVDDDDLVRQRAADGRAAIEGSSRDRSLCCGSR